MSRWTGNGVASGTGVTTGNVNTSGNGDTPASVTFSTSGTFTATYATDGVDITTAAAGIVRWDLARTAGLYGRTQFLYTPKETPASNMDVSTFRSAAALAGSGMHFATGIFGFQNSAAATVLGANTPVALTVNDEYLIDQVCVVGGSTTTGRYFYRIRDLTNLAWNTTGEFFYDSGLTINTGTANLTVHRVGKVGNVPAMNTGLRVRQISWSDLAAVDSSSDGTITRSHFFPNPFSLPEKVVMQQSVQRAATR